MNHGLKEELNSIAGEERSASPMVDQTDVCLKSIGGHEEKAVNAAPRHGSQPLTKECGMLDARGNLWDEMASNLSPRPASRGHFLCEPSRPRGFDLLDPCR